MTNFLSRLQKFSHNILVPELSCPNPHKLFLWIHSLPHNRRPIQSTATAVALFLTATAVAVALFLTAIAAPTATLFLEPSLSPPLPQPPQLPSPPPPPHPLL
ncbi:hypothetical protein RIF29_15150 [Crotalaria pallida]|uniref:Uncharacterized protein n=1 Tax=Crotalaria pallida TaxID=3830 RepID=A0AAN9FD23_CROPI